jgi:peptide/nickel transport system substrate-binding protein
VSPGQGKERERRNEMKRRNGAKRTGTFLLVVAVVLSFLVACGATPAPQVVTEIVKETVVVGGTPQVVEKTVTKVVEATKLVTVEVAKPVVKPDTLIILAASLTPGFDTDVWGGKAEEQVIMNVYDMMFDYQIVQPADIGLLPGPGVTGVAKVNGVGDQGMVGAAFESWKISDDGQTITLKVRQGEKSYWGNQMTADDFIWRVQRAFALNQVGAFGFTVMGITGPQDVTKIDDMTVQMHTPKGPSPIFFKVGAIPFMNTFDVKAMKAAGVLTDKDPWGTEALKTSDWGYGAYHVVEYVPGSHVKYVANPNYWKGEPAFKNVIVQEVPESANRLALMIAGDAHWTTDLTIAEKYALVGGKGEATYVGMPESNWHLAFYVSRAQGAFVNADCYQALGYAIPYEKIRDNAYKGFGKIAQELVPPVYGETVDVGGCKYHYDIEKARELWKQGNCPNKFTMTMDTEHPEWEDVGILIRTEFEKLGVEAVIDKEPQAVISTKQTAKALEFSFEESTAFVADAGYALWLNWDKASPFNYQGWNNDQASALIDQSLAMIGSPERDKILFEVQKIACDEGGMMYVLWTGYHNAASKHLGGVIWYPTNQIHWDDVYWTE